MLSPLTCAAGQVTQGETCLLWYADAEKRAQISFFFFFGYIVYFSTQTKGLYLPHSWKSLELSDDLLIRRVAELERLQWDRKREEEEEGRNCGKKRRSLDQPVCLSKETPKGTAEGTNHSVNVSQPQQTAETTWRFPCRSKTLDTRSKHSKKSTQLTLYLRCVSSHADATNMKTQTGWKCWSCAVNSHLF